MSKNGMRMISLQYRIGQIFNNTDVPYCCLDSSCLKTIHALVAHPLLPIMTILDHFFLLQTRWIHPTFYKLWNDFFEGDFPSNGKRIFHEHYHNVRQLVPQENLLIYHVQEGWEPLCKFLDQPVPEIPFPTGNEMVVFLKRFEAAMFYKAREYLTNILHVSGYAAMLYLGISTLKSYY
jgi:hypothetical protein